MKQLFRLIAFLSGIVVAVPSAAAPFYGIAQGMDGDSLRVGDREVRLFGIDAPEFDQSCKRGGQAWACGAAAADQLSQLVTGKEVRCLKVGTDQHERVLGRCSVGTTDINRTMVAAGFAVAFRRYSTDYVAVEASAKAAKRGIWAGTFQMPQQYRGEMEATGAKPARTRRTTVAARPLATSAGCAIKGNRGSNGWIYHLPGMPFYERTVAEEMFCSEAQAQAAGYRRARVR